MMQWCSVPQLFNLLDHVKLKISSWSNILTIFSFLDILALQRLIGKSGGSSRESSSQCGIQPWLQRSMEKRINQYPDLTLSLSSNLLSIMLVKLKQNYSLREAMWSFHRAQPPEAENTIKTNKNWEYGLAQWRQNYWTVHNIPDLKDMSIHNSLKSYRPFPRHRDL